MFACAAAGCDRTIAYSPEVDDVVIDAGIRDVDFAELHLYPERYAGRRVRARGWLSLGVHTYGDLNGVPIDMDGWSDEQRDWLWRETHGQPFGRYVEVVVTANVSSMGRPYFSELTEISQAERPARR